MNRITAKFNTLRRKKKKAFIAYLTAGYPSLSVTEKLVPALEQAGVDLIELGVPFSDPLADGPTIQDASFQALKKGVNATQILDSVKRIRRKSQIPMALMTYYNPVFGYPQAKFIQAAKKAGVDGLIIPDLPVEEASGFIRLAQKSDMATVFFVAPTTLRERKKKIIQASSGFIYYISLAGVTGARTQLPKDLISGVKDTKALTDKPVCVGFGISTPQQVKSISRLCDGVIVGSAIIKEIKRNIKSRDLVPRVSRFVRRLAASVS